MEKTTLRSLILITIITGSFFTFVACGSNQATPASSNTTVNFQPATQNSGVKITTKYADGTYTVEAPYDCPGGMTSITVAVAVKDDTVQSLNVVGQGNGGAIKRYQGFFIDGVNSEVVGKKLADVKMGIVNGASLTSNAFNGAISSVVAKATK